MGRNKAPYEKVPDSVALFGPANKWARHGHFYLMCRKKTKQRLKNLKENQTSVSNPRITYLCLVFL